VVLVLAVLLGGTAATGLVLRDRLDDAAEVLDPLVDPVLVDQREASNGLGVPVCRDQTAIAGEVGRFREAVEQARTEAETTGKAVPPLTRTRASFDSFLFRSATARLASDPLILVVRARYDDGRWCLDEVEVTSEG
jgi:hypothetical protein